VAALSHEKQNAQLISTFLLTAMFKLMSKKSQVAQAIAKKPGDHILVHLKLDGRLKPVSLSKFETAGNKPFPLEMLANSLVL